MGLKPQVAASTLKINNALQPFPEEHGIETIIFARNNRFIQRLQPFPEEHGIETARLS